MSADESIAWLQSAINHERAVAASWSLAGWPGPANFYRLNALKGMRILRRVRKADNRTALPPLFHAVTLARKEVAS